LTAGNITTVSPSSGQEGTRVTISGSRLLGDGSVAESVTLAGISATITGATATQINVTAAASAARSGDVVVVSDTGIAVTKQGAWQYMPSGYIDTADPSTGVGGTETVIDGFQLFGYGSSLVSVTLAGVPATVKFASRFYLRIAAGVGPAGVTGDIVLTSDTGAVVRKINAWTYAIVGNISSVQPAVGAFNALVTIQGTGLRSGGDSVSDVAIAGVPATIVSENNTVVVVRAGRNNVGGIGDVQLTSNDGAVVVAKSAFEYVSVSEIHSIVPAKGQAGTLVTMTGISLLGGADRLASVTLAGVAVSSITNQSSSFVVVEAAPSTPGTGDVILTGSNGALITRRNGFAYVAVPSIATVAPATGQVGTRVTLTGSGMLGGGLSVGSLTLAGTAVQEVIAANDSTIIVRAAANSTQTSGNAVLTADTGAVVTKVDSWTYLPASAIATVVPNQGQFGTIATVSGSSLRGGSSTVVAATLGGVPGTVVSENNTEVVVRAGSGSAGSGHVVLTADSGATSTLENGWTYLAPGVILALTPSSGQLNTVVTVAGTNLLGGGSTVAEATLKGVSVTVVSGNATEVVIRAGTASAGIGDLSLVANTGAQVTGANLWTQLAAGAISSVSPSDGQAGTYVNITGSNLLGGASEIVSVTLVGTPATIISSSSTLIIVQAVARGAGSGDVVITSLQGATTTKVNSWTYLAPSNITGISPAQGQDGTRVTLQGTALLKTGDTIAAVSLNGVPVKSISSASATEISVVAAAGSVGTGDVKCTATSGAVVILPNGWEYLAAATVSDVKPTTGQAGTKITISGARLLGGGASLAFVTLVGVNATIKSANNTVIVVSAGDGGSGAGDAVLVADTGATVRAKAVFTYETPGAIASI